MKLISNISKIEIIKSVLFEKLCVVENYKKIMPENVSKFEIIDSNSFIFSIKGMPPIKLKFGEKIEHSKIILQSLDSKINFTLTAFLNKIDSKNTSFQLEFNGDLNAMIEMMVKSPLQSFIDDLSKNIINLN
tara:strand:+ start:4750 stop:5145 length:396 start_codon:yes stop_codon:yes gene_type:complete